VFTTSIKKMTMISTISLKKWSSKLGVEKTISMKEHERERHDFDPTTFYKNRFWNRRSDGIMINKNLQTLYILEFKKVI